MHRRNHSAQVRHASIAPILEGTGTLDTAAEVTGVTRRTIQRWLKAFRAEGFMGLTPEKRTDHARPRRANTNWKALTVALSLTRPGLTIKAVHDWISQQASRQALKPPGYFTVHRWYHQIDPALQALATYGTQAYKHQYELVHRWETNAPNALWQADHTLLDVQILDERGMSVRPWLTLVEDDYSRAICGYVLSTDHPNALQTALALRHAISPKSRTDWPVYGLPERLYTDRGKDFVSDHMEEICLRLHIEVTRSRPRQPRGKGKIERLFDTLNTGLLSRLPGYTKMPTGQLPQGSLLTLAELDQQLEAFIITTYHDRPHRTTGMAPLARWVAGGFMPQVPADWAVLDEFLLTISKPRKVQRDGIRFRGFRYLAPTLAAYVGESVVIRYDPRDLADIRVYYQDAFLCRALCQAIAGQVVSLKEIQRARRQVRQARQAQLQQARQTIQSMNERPAFAPAEPAFLLPPAPDLLWPASTETPADSSQPLKLYRYGHRR